MDSPPVRMPFRQGHRRVIRHGPVIHLHVDGHSLPVRQQIAGVAAQAAVWQLPGVDGLHLLPLGLLPGDVHIIRHRRESGWGFSGSFSGTRAAPDGPCPRHHTPHTPGSADRPPPPAGSAPAQRPAPPCPGYSAPVAMISFVVMARTSVHANASGLDAVQLTHPAGMAAALKLSVFRNTSTLRLARLPVMPAPRASTLASLADGGSSRQTGNR